MEEHHEVALSIYRSLAFKRILMSAPVELFNEGGDARIGQEVWNVLERTNCALAVDGRAGVQEENDLVRKVLLPDLLGNLKTQVEIFTVLTAYENKLSCLTMKHFRSPRPRRERDRMFTSNQVGEELFAAALDFAFCHHWPALPFFRELPEKLAALLKELADGGKTKRHTHKPYFDTDLNHAREAVNHRGVSVLAGLKKVLLLVRRTLARGDVTWEHALPRLRKVIEGANATMQKVALSIKLDQLEEGVWSHHFVLHFRHRKSKTRTAPMKRYQDPETKRLLCMFVEERQRWLFKTKWAHC